MAGLYTRNRGLDELKDTTISAEVSVTMQFVLSEYKQDLLEEVEHFFGFFVVTLELVPNTGVQMVKDFGLDLAHFSTNFC